MRFDPEPIRDHPPSHLFELPYLVFLGVLLFTLWVSLFAPSPEQQPATLPALSLGLTSAGARCPNSCLIDVCLRWVPGPSPRCPSPGPGGGCCLRYGQKCDPSCTDGGDQPPSISATVICNQWGGNGWCIDGPQLALTVSDPQGYAVSISGEAGGETISCDGDCTIDLPAGSGIATYVATSDISNLTASGSTAWAYDPESPVPDIDLSGTNGSNGWYVSPLSVSATGTDAISGLAGASISVDGGPEQASASLNEGVHTVVVSVIDNAGNSASSAPLTLAIDTTTPVITSAVTGALGANGWYVSEAQVSADASDATSGLDGLQLSLDSGAWTDYAAPIILTDGVHTLRLRATDLAGNQTTSASQQFSVDTTAPDITTTINGTAGSNSWYLSNVQVSATAGDPSSGLGPASGLGVLEVSSDGGAWQPYSVPLAFTSGQHALKFRATDNAGNLSQLTRNVQLDSMPPVIDLPAEWTLGRTIDYTVADPQSGLASVRVVIEDEGEKYPKVSWEEGDATGLSFDGGIDWDGTFANGISAPPGEYLVWVKASDQAGNESVKLGRVTVSQGFNLFSLFLPTRTPRPTIVPSALSVVESPAPAATPIGAVLDTPNKPQISTSLSSSGGASNGRSAPEPFETNLPMVSAALAAMTAATAYATQRREEDPEPSGYKSKRRAEKLAEMDAEGEARAEQQAYQSWLSTGKNPPRGLGDVTEAERLAMYQQTDRYQSYVAGLQTWEKEKQAEETARADAARQQAYADYRRGEHAPEEVDLSTGGAGKLAAPALNHTPDGDPPPSNPIVAFFDWIGNTIQHVGDTITQLLQGRKPTPSTPDLVATQAAQLIPTLWAQYTQTAQAISTSTPTLQPTPTPTLVPANMWVTYPANFHLESPDGPLDSKNFPNGLPPGSTVIPTGKIEVGSNGHTYQQVTINGQIGWVISDFLESVVVNPPQLVADPNKYVKIDPALSAGAGFAAQDLKLNIGSVLTGKIEAGETILFNLCAQFAASYVTGRPIGTFLADWITNVPDAKNILQMDDTTGIPDIRKMLDVYGCRYRPVANSQGPQLDLREAFQLRIGDENLVILTPGAIQKQLNLGNKLILGVGVNQSTGAVNQGNIPHWVVVEKVQPAGVNNGQVLFYNPLPNIQQVVSYDQLQQGWDTFIRVNGGFSGSPPMGLFVDASSCTPYMPSP